MHKIDPTVRQRKGTVLMLLLFMLPVMLLLCAFAINIAYMELNRTELYTAADAAARAGGRELNITRNPASARIKGKAIGLLNEVAGTPLTLSNSDFVFGSSSRPSISSKYVFTQGGANPNSVQITARRTSGSPNGPIQLMLPSVFDLNNFEAQQTSTSTQIEVDVALVIDRSGSMAYAVNEVAAFPPAPFSAPPGWTFCDAVPPASRWNNVVAAVAVFLSEITASPTSELVSLSTYNDFAVTERPLTSNYASILAALAPYTSNFCAGRTNIGGGINQGASTLLNGGGSRPGAVKVIVVLTDGIHNVGLNPITTAATAASAGTMIFTVTFSNEAAQAQMQQVAALGKGKHYHANTPTDLIAVFQDIARQLPTLLTQ